MRLGSDLLLFLLFDFGCCPIGQTGTVRKHISALEIPGSLVCGSGRKMRRRMKSGLFVCLFLLISLGVTIVNTILSFCSSTQCMDISEKISIFFVIIRFFPIMYLV
jgi:hypothetical protein